MKINVVLLLYLREYFLETQLNNLSKQDHLNDMYFHIICNNPEKKEKYKNILKKFDNILNYTFIERKNEMRMFERHVYILSKNLDFVIILDDDLLLNKSDIYDLYQKREKNTYTTFYGRRFDNRTDLKKLHSSNMPTVINPKNNFDYFNYGGTGFSIIDCNIYQKIFETYKKMDKKFIDHIHSLDDSFISWVINCQDDWKIKNSRIVPINFPNLDEYASYLTVKNKKNELYYFLHNITPWKIIK